MWKLNFTESARKSVYEYFSAYKNYFLERFTDTGIWSEEIIRSGYESDSEELFGFVMDTLVEKLSRGVVPFSQIGEQRYCVLSCHDRFIGVIYIENVEESLRSIAEIKIWRKR